MRIGIIGAGNIGGTLVRKFTQAGHTVKVANSRGPESLKDLAKETGATPVHVHEAVQGVDLVVITIPEKNIPHLPRDLFSHVPESVIVVDTGNYYPGLRDGPIQAIDSGLAESKWVAQHIGRPVVKAFNNIIAGSLLNNGRPAGTKGRIALPVAGDNPRHKQIVISLLNEIGFDGIDAGSLDESWRQQPGAPVYCTDLTAEEVPRALSQAEKSKAPQMRELSIQKMKEHGLNFQNANEVVKLARTLHGQSGVKGC